MSQSAPDDPLATQIEGQVGVAERVGSQFYVTLLRRMRDHALAHGPVRDALRGHERDRIEEWDAPNPSTGGDGYANAAWPAVRELIAAGRAEIVDSLSHPLQTNAVTRAKALVGGLCLVAEKTNRPLRLLELGASAGLNLRLDRFHFEDGGASFGPADSPVRFADFLTGGRPPLAHGFEVAERAGCDLHPIDPTTEEGRLTLLACIFPDEKPRFELLERAIEVARATPVTVERADLAAWAADRLADPRPGLTTVVYHTIVWPYLPDAVREQAEDVIAAAGERATADAPLALLAFEGAADQPALAELRLTVWPGGRERLLARTSFHPVTVDWVADQA